MDRKLGKRDIDYTIFGGTGFIGSHLVAFLEGKGYRVYVPKRAEVFSDLSDLGRVIYCIGVAGDFRPRPFDTIELNVELLSKILRSGTFTSFVYLSSTRIYGSKDFVSRAAEDSRFTVFPDSDAIYDLSKLLGESLCATQHSRNIQIARLSNVVGAHLNSSTFLGALASTIQSKTTVVIKEGPNSSKDYI